MTGVFVITACPNFVKFYSVFCTTRGLTWVWWLKWGLFINTEEFNFSPGELSVQLSHNLVTSSIVGLLHRKQDKVPVPHSGPVDLMYDTQISKIYNSMNSN